MKKVLMMVALMLVSVSAMAQQVDCVQSEKEHYYVAEATTKTAMPETLKAVLTDKEKLIWQNTYSNSSVTSIAHKDLAACNNALDFLKAQRAIAPQGGIHASQSLSYQGRCFAVEICP